MKQKFWSFGDDFVIRDDRDNDCYQVDGEVFSFGDNLSLRDMAGNEVASIRQRLLSWGPTHEIHRPGHHATVVGKEHFTFFRCSSRWMVPEKRTMRRPVTSSIMSMRSTGKMARPRW